MATLTSADRTSADRTSADRTITDRISAPMTIAPITSAEPYAAAPTNHDAPPAGSELGLTTLDTGLAQELVRLFKLMADETRLRILHFLMQAQELNVRTLCGLLDQSQPAVSHHLALLKEAGLIECRRDGKHNFYRIVPQQCAAHLDRVFGVVGSQTRKLRLDDAVLTYGRDGQG